MVQEAVRDNETLQKELVTQVAIYGGADEALMWANHYGIGREHWPYNVRVLSDNREGRTYVGVLLMEVFLDFVFVQK